MASSGSPRLCIIDKYTKVDHCVDRSIRLFDAPSLGCPVESLRLLPCDLQSVTRGLRSVFPRACYVSGVENRLQRVKA